MVSKIHTSIDIKRVIKIHKGHYQQTVDMLEYWFPIQKHSSCSMNGGGILFWYTDFYYKGSVPTYTFSAANFKSTFLYVLYL